MLPETDNSFLVLFFKKEHSFLTSVLRQVVVGLAMLLTAAAAVNADRASLLRGALTPLGAERSGNAEGSIPAWTGAVMQADPGGRERPLLVIDHANFQHYASRLPQGALALFARYPDYFMRVFPTHRTAAAPDWVYANVAANAARAHAAAEGIAYGVEGAAGGVPFPLPQNGTEIVWNHLLAYWGTAREAHVATFIASGDGSIEQTAGYREITDFPFYAPHATPATVGQYYFKTRRLQDAPASRAGEAYIAWQPLNIAQSRFVAWRYLPGEHRVRKAPSLSYDTPDADASGYEELDDYYLFFGGPDRYDFRVVGKREMYVPYNNDALNAMAPRAAMGPLHANQDALRYELHRVWVVEGILAAGKHHVAPRRRLYVDEDSWLVEYSEAWDDDGRLWKFGHATMTLRPEIPAVIIGAQYMYDLLQGGYCYDFAFGGPDGYYHATPLHDATTFSADALAADSLK
jgi:hypothetical protein